jgi:hypothetical protein
MSHIPVTVFGVSNIYCKVSHKDLDGGFCVFSFHFSKQFKYTQDCPEFTLYEKLIPDKFKLNAFIGSIIYLVVLFLNFAILLVST